MHTPVFFINLDERGDRRAFMEAQFSSLGIAAERVSAVSAATLPARDVERYCNPARVHCLSRSQFACWQSHIKAWHAFLASGADWAIILEDDAILSARLPSFVTAFFAEGAAARFDLVQLETMARNTRVLPPETAVDGLALRRFRSTIWGAAAYLISAPTVRALLARDGLFHAPADGVLFRPYVAPGSGFRMVLTDPALAIQIHQTENTGIALGNIAPVKPKASVGVTLLRQWEELKVFAVDAADHLRHMSKGITKEVIPFDAPDGRFVGSKLSRYGVELSTGG
jgi:glycosyl transferase family 25